MQGTAAKPKPVGRHQSRATAATRHAERTAQTQRVIAKSERLMARSRELLDVAKELVKRGQTTWERNRASSNGNGRG